ncbi:MAG: SH3 domain-containing protein [Spirochaetales bacterium]|nr:SH3 domain-containing protein [Leptospiraceae bacterium]MCP5481798.1 SH3 domain-containing protein [Spirochaetales bacterium]
MGASMRNACNMFVLISRTVRVAPLFFALMMSACNEAEPAMARVNADGGLRMRATASVHAEKLATIPNGTHVEVLRTTGEEIEISGRVGRWTEVRYQGNIGWVFGGFLSLSDQGPVRDPVSAGSGSNSGSPYYLVSDESSPLRSLLYYENDRMAFLREPCYDASCTETSNIVLMVGLLQGDSITFWDPGRTILYLQCDFALPRMSCRDNDTGLLSNSSLEQVSEESVSDLPEFHDPAAVSAELDRIFAGEL